MGMTHPPHLNNVKKLHFYYPEASLIPSQTLSIT